jgi:hypothetical protein
MGGVHSALEQTDGNVGGETVLYCGRTIRFYACCEKASWICQIFEFVKTVAYLRQFKLKAFYL